MTDREAMKMALDALERGTTGLAIRAIPALRQALAQEQTKCPRCGEVNPAEIHTCSPQVAQEQEPVAWMVLTQDDKKLMLWGQEKPPIFDAPVKLIPLYTAPPKQWVGLTDEEIKDILDCGRGGLVDIKKAEQILKEKNT